MSAKNKLKIRCPWVGDDTQMQVYHDTVWGRPTKDDKQIFKALVLDTNQAGLSWKCILHKQDNFAGATSVINTAFQTGWARWP